MIGNTNGIDRSPPKGGAPPRREALPEEALSMTARTRGNAGPTRGRSVEVIRGKNVNRRAGKENDLQAENGEEVDLREGLGDHEAKIGTKIDMENDLIGPVTKWHNSKN